MFGANISGRHIVLFYEREESATKLKCEFVKTGLSRQEFCIYSTDRSVNSVERALTDFGIDVARFRKRGLLEIQRIAWPKEPQTLEYYMEKGNKFLTQRPHLVKRIVGIYGQQCTLRHCISGGIAMERLCASIVADRNESVMCAYDVKKVPIKDRAGWMVEMLKNHDTAVFAEKKGQSQIIEL